MLKHQKEISVKENKDQQNSDMQMDLLNFSEGSISFCQSKKKLQKMNSTDQSATESDSKKLSLTPEMLLILDTETTGLDPNEHFCMEIGGVLFNVGSREILAQQSFLIPVETNGAEFINRIPAEITQLNQHWRKGLEYFEVLLDSADVVVAHNADFDRQWFGKAPLPSISKKWICTMEDIAWPDNRVQSSRPSVRDLALSYGVPVWNAHRALTDCIYLAEVFRRCEDLEDLLLKGLEPRRLMRAQVSYDQRHLAKKAGFRWNDPVPGAWTRRLSEREALELNFSVICLEDED